MTQEPPRPLPQSTVQATGQVASDVVLGLKQQPALLAVVVLNLVAVVAAVWFLRELAGNSRADRQQILTMLERCLDGGPHERGEPNAGR